MASQIETAIASAATNIRSSRLLRGAATAVTVPSEIAMSAPVTGVFCIEEITATFCNVATGPNTGGYGLYRTRRSALCHACSRALSRVLPGRAPFNELCCSPQRPNADSISLAAFNQSQLSAQQPQQPQISDPSPAQAGMLPNGTFLLTIFLKYDESKTLDQINAQLKAQGFYKEFPPEGTQVVSLYVMMGVGQVVTLRLPAERLRDVNRAIERTAWGGYRTEFYPTYNYKNIGEDNHAKASAQ